MIIVEVFLFELTHLSSINISGSMSNSSISINLALVSDDKFSIKFATSDGCKSSKV